MRITPAMQFRRFVESLRAIRERQAADQSRLASGRKLERPSDDPAGAAQAILDRSGIASLERYSANAAAGRALLAATDSTLSSLSGLLAQARAAAIRGASDTTAAGRAEIAAEIDSIREQFLAGARAQFRGRFLFSGTETATDPYDATGAYQGNDGAIRIQTGESETIDLNLDGPRVFGSGGGVFGLLEDLAAALRAGDTAAIQAAATTLEAAGTRISESRGEVGRRMNRLDAAVDRNAEARSTLLARLSAVEDADLAEVITRLANDRAAEQATLAVGARIGSRSLFDYLG